MSDNGGTTPPRPTRWPALSPSRRWLLVGAAGLFIVLFVGVATGSGGGPELPPRTVEDRQFARQANDACARRLPALRRDRARRRTGEEGKETVLAGTVERAADELERLAAEVRNLPVAAGDQPEVTAWLQEWDAYVAVGRRFADALRRRDNKSYGRLASESTDLSERIYAFAKANGMEECAF